MQMLGQVPETEMSETVNLHTHATGSHCCGQQLSNSGDPSNKTNRSILHEVCLTALCLPLYKVTLACDNFLQ